MKKIIYLFIMLSILFSCKKKAGKINYSLTYTTSSGGKIHKQADAAKSKGLYTQFGDYITSVTPSKYIANFWSLRFYDNKQIINEGHILGLIDGNLPLNDPQHIADFSGNSTLDILPIIYGTTGSDGLFSDKEIQFIYLGFTANYFYQEATLPVQYNGVSLSQFNHQYFTNVYKSDSVKPGNVLTVDNFPLMYYLFDVDSHGFPMDYIFGNTDSTRVVYLDAGQSIPELDPTAATHPFIGPISNFVWSNHYSAFTLISPDDGETLNVNCILGFNITNLIQIYAGADNIPYTSDDMIVYAPNFWERINVTVNIN